MADSIKCTSSFQSSENHTCIEPHWRFPVYQDIHRAEDLIAREIKKPPERLQDMLGVCFSGGGSRSLSLVRGQIAALKYLGYEKNINYISAVSGGVWGAMSYYGLPKKEQQKAFLGEVVEAVSDLYSGGDDEALSENINWLEAGSLGRVPQRLSLGSVGERFIEKTYQEGRNVWANYLAESLLSPYGMDGKAPLSEALFPFKPDHMQLIVNAALMNDDRRVQPFEITPVAMGARKTVFSQGGYMVRPQDFGSVPNSSHTGSTHASFTLGDMFAVTSANFARFFSKFWRFMSWFELGVPAFPYPALNISGSSEAFPEYDLIDIAWNDYLGLMPLLVRKQYRIIVFVNTDVPLVAKRVFDVSKEDRVIVGMEKVIASYFGIIPDEKAEHSEYKSSLGGRDCGIYCSRNWVFPQERYGELADGLWQARQQGGPLVYLQENLPVLGNSVNGVSGGWKVDILWVYNDLSDNWFNELHLDLQNMLHNDWDFRKSWLALSKYESGNTRFPHFDATKELNLNVRQVNMLFHLATWTLLNSRALLERLISRPI